jgi:hypothetical protein
MSETVRNRGQFIKIDKISTETLEDTCMRICMVRKLKSLEEYECYDTYEELLLEELYNEYFVYNDELYNVVRQKEVDPYDDYVNIEKNGKIYNFDTSYYNGGACLTEMLIEGLENYKGEQYE